MTVVLAVAAVTVGSRVAAAAFLPAPRGASAAIIARLPGPLFAAMAAVSAVDAARGEARMPVLVAAACALGSVGRRSLLVTLAAGLVGFSVASAVL